MKIKLDEHLGARGLQLLEAGGFDVATVISEGLSSSSDETLIEVCRTEGRALVSLDSVNRAMGPLRTICPEDEVR